MRCCVPGCKNDSRHISKLQGVTFHVFPNEQAQRTAWLRALGKTSWEPKDRSAVCSEHFLCDDLYETRSGLRKVRSGAVPMILQDIPNCDFGDPAAMKVCRICLTMDTILYPFKKYKLDHAFEQLTGLTLEDGDNLPQKLCVECAYRLVNSSKLRNKSLRANSLLCELVRKHDFLTIQNIKSISRDNNQLTSNLNHKYFEPDHFDLYLEHTDETNKPIEVIVEDVEIKNETDIFMNENEDLKEDISEAKNGQPEIRQEECQQVEEIADQDDNDDQDFALSDKEFSSDDSLPLEKRRSRKKVKHKRLKSCEDITKKVRKRQIKKDPSEPKIDRRRKPFLNEDLNETLFSITDLTFEEQVAEILKRQESANYKNAVFKCTECFKGFLDEDAYNSHMSRHTKECGEYQCDICKTHFRHSHALRKHITAHHTQRFSCNQCPYVTTHRQCDICNALRKHITAHHTQRFSCNQCPYVTTHRQTARLHERWHKGTKYQCPHCPDEFVKFTTYMGHIRIKHPSDFVCQLCGFSFVSEKGIELHKKLKHRLDNDEIPADGPLCEPCNVRFISEDAYRQHLRVSARHNTSDKEHRESNKPKKGRKSKEAKEREKMAREKNDQEEDDKRRLYPSQMRKAEGPIPCEQCGMQLEDSRAYHGHFRRMHPDKNRTNYPSMKSPCMCEVCGRMFQSYALLKDHRWVHTGERPFKCSECSKSFRMKQRLVAHRKVHSSVKASYLCNLCGKHFSTHSNRQRHMIIHTGLRPFRCEMCEKSFKHASEKRAHITYVHLKKPWPKRSRAKRRDNRQGLPPQQSAPSSDMEVAQPLWPCDPKLDHINTIMDDKPMYYNLKI